MGIFILYGIVDRVEDSTGAALIEPVAHIHCCTVDKLALEVGIFHQSPEKTSVLVLVAPIGAWIIVGVVYPLDGIIVCVYTIKSQSKVGNVLYILHQNKGVEIYG